MSKRSDTVIENLLVAQAMMIDVPPELIVPKLQAWTEPLGMTHECGSAACFGGLVARHPHFQKQGVYAAESGAPNTNDTLFPCDVSELLFGNEQMFRSNMESGLPDREVIFSRIETQLNNVLDAATSHSP